MSVWGFVLYSVSLGVGLAADAFSVSVVNGIKRPHMRLSGAALIAGVFALFQALMPMAGWLLTNTLMDHFHVLQRLLPRISQFFLLYLGIRMLLERGEKPAADAELTKLTMPELLLQAVATSVDALLIGFAIASYAPLQALSCALMIAGVTFILCFLGVHWGRVLGLKLAGKAAVLSGVVLLIIAVGNFVNMPPPLP